MPPLMNPYAQSKYERVLESLVPVDKSLFTGGKEKSYIYYEFVNFEGVSSTNWHRLTSCTRLRDPQ